MGVLINTPIHRDRHTQTVDLDGTRYRLRLSWNSRTSSWYMDLFDLDEVQIAVGRRLSPGFITIPDNVPNAPTGVFWVLGQLDPYKREDLGVSVLLDYVSRVEIDAVAVDDDPETIFVTILP